MPDVSFELERLSNQFVEKVNQSRDELVNAFYDATKDMAQDERMVFIDSASVDVLMANKLSNAMSIYEEGIRRTLESTFTTAEISEDSLRILLNRAKSRINTEVTKHLSEEMMDAIIDGMANNQFPNQIIKNIDSKLPTHQLETLVNTTYNQFNNSLTNLMAESLPDNTKFIYIGLWDEKTRDRCVDKIKMSPATKTEIIKKYGNLDNELWRCRHKWEEMSDKPFAQGLEKQKEVGDA